MIRNYLLAPLCTTFLILSFSSSVVAETGVKKSRLVHDFLSENRAARREHGVSINTQSTERACYDNNSSVEDCSAAVASAKKDLNAQIAKKQKEVKNKEDEQSVVVQQGGLTNRQVRRLANSPANKPSIGRPNTPRPRPPIARPR